MDRTVTITGSKAKLEKIARAFGVAVGVNPRTETPVVVATVAADCVVTSAHLLPDGRVSTHLVDGGTRFYEDAAAFRAALRGWTPEKGEVLVAVNAQYRCERIRAEMAVDRRITF